MAKKILEGHKKVGQKFIPPLTQVIGNMVEVSYINQILPEIIWMGVLIEKMGVRKGIKIIELLTTAAFKNKAQKEHVNFAICSNFSRLSKRSRNAILQDNEIKSELENISISLSLINNLYEGFPLSFLCKPVTEYDESKLLMEFADILVKYWDKFDQPASIIQANVLYVRTINDGMRFAEGLEPDLEAIFDNPETENGRRAKSRVRMAAMMEFMHCDSEPANSWPRSFWNQGLRNSQCIFLGRENDTQAD